MSTAGAYESVMGKHGLGQRNDNGERFCDMCDMNELVITEKYTLFPHKTIHKVAWQCHEPDRPRTN